MIKNISVYKFAIFFVLFELTTYLSNDMIMPAMPKVIQQFHAPLSKMILALTYFVIGGSLLQVFLGPLTELFGKRRVLLIGNLFFLLTTILILFSTNIDYFLMMRFFQGMGICFIFIGYAVIHETYTDVEAVKLISLLSNTGIFAPLIGPVLGSIIYITLNWQAVFVITAICSFVALVGLFKNMPKDKEFKAINIQGIITSYKSILSNKVFMFGIFLAGITIVPLTGWIGLSPTIIRDTLHKSNFTYILYQLVIFSGFIFSSLFIQKLAGRVSFKKLLLSGAIIQLVGILGAAVFCQSPSVFIWFMFTYAAGYGLFNASLIRISLMSTGEPTGLSSACMSLLYCIYISIGLQVYNFLGSSFTFSLTMYAITNLFIGVTAFVGLLIFTKYSNILNANQ